MKERPRAKCHPDRAHASRGLCNACYSTWRYRNQPEYRAARLAAKSYNRRTRNPRVYHPSGYDIPPRFEGVKGYKWHFTAKDDAALEACLQRRGLAYGRDGMVWRKAA